MGRILLWSVCRLLLVIILAFLIFCYFIGWK
jgi:hypothetical protein